jgi:inosine/xanthosine triphosphate pyrophosphatase family protein
VVAHTCNLSTWEAETIGLQIQVQPGLHSETLSQKKKKRKKKNGIMTEVKGVLDKTSLFVTSGLLMEK